MRTQRALLVLTIVLGLCPFLEAKDTSEYATLLASVKGGATIIDYGQLRRSYMDSPEYKNAKDTSKAEKDMMAALNAKDFAGALKNADIVLAEDYVNIDAHFVAYIANRELGKTDKAEFHHAVFQGLLNSIQNSGDGLSTEKAWVVINVHEEYVMLRALGFMPGSQSLQEKDGHSFDVMKVKSRTDGSEKTFYFNVDIPFKHGL